MTRAPSSAVSPPRDATVGHERRTWAVAAVNGAAMAVLVVGGLALGSAAVLAEGLHMGAHLGALAIAAIAYRIAAGLRARGEAGARRVVDLAGLANALLLVLVAAFLTLESVGDLIHPVAIDLRAALGLAGFGVVVNFLSLAVLRHSHRHEPGHHRDMSFRAIYLHMAGDAAVGLMSIAGLLAVRFMGWRWADGVAGLAGAALLAVLAVQIGLAVVRANGGAAPVKRSVPLPACLDGKLSPAPSCRS